jgi:hypothetical protein
LERPRLVAAGQLVRPPSGDSVGAGGSGYRSAAASSETGSADECERRPRQHPGDGQLQRSREQHPDGDGKSDLAVFRPSIGGWFIRFSSQGFSIATASFYQWGLPGDVPIAADFDDDGRTELTVFQPATGEWFIRYSTQNYDVGGLGLYQWGLAGDLPIKP